MNNTAYGLAQHFMYNMRKTIEMTTVVCFLNSVLTL